MDEVDIANDLVDRAREQALRIAPVPRQSRTSCLECGDHISEARRRVVPGARYCVGCAQDDEMRRKHYAP